MKLAIAGGGLIVRTAAPYLEKWGWEPDGICVTENGIGRAAELAKQWGNPPVYTDYDRMLDRTGARVIYIAVPNHLHFSFAKKALERGFHVILEKPVTSNFREAEILVRLAKEKNLMLFEAITTIHLPSYDLIRQNLEKIGKVKLVSCNFSQYSSRYDAFRQGIIAPVFDPQKSGGALMDLNIYNIHWVMNLFGSPKGVSYRANVERGIDTSGVLTMEYPDFQAVCVAAKDCAAPCRCIIQGTQGYILQEKPANEGGAIIVRLNDGQEEGLEAPVTHRMEPEFLFFRQQIEAGDPARCHALLNFSLEVAKVLQLSRDCAGIRFPADKIQ